MFDAQNDRRQEPFEDKPKASLADAKFKKQIAVIVAVAVLLIEIGRASCRERV